MVLSRTLSGTLLVAGAATLWGFNGTISTAVMEAGLPPSRLAEARIVIGALILLAWLVWRDRASLRLTRREALMFAVFGIVGLVGVQWFYFEAISRIPVSISLVIEYSAPLVVALWVRFAWKRRLPWQAWAAIPVALVGLALVLDLAGGVDERLSMLGVALSVCAAACYAYYALHAERLTQRRSATSVLGIGLAFGALALLIVQPPWSFPFDGLQVETDALGVALPLWPLLLWVAVFGTVVPFAMLISGVRRMGADGATVTAMIEPIVAGAFAWALLGQSLGVGQIIGGLIVLAAVAWAQLSRARSEVTPA
ncbi:MAG: EamA family transporter [Gaiellales bacterium]